MTIALRMRRELNKFRMTTFSELASPLCITLISIAVPNYWNGDFSMIAGLNVRASTKRERSAKLPVWKQFHIH